MFECAKFSGFLDFSIVDLERKRCSYRRVEMIYNFLNKRLTLHLRKNFIWKIYLGIIAQKLIRIKRNWSDLFELLSRKHLQKVFFIHWTRWVSPSFTEWSWSGSWMFLDCSLNHSRAFNRSENNKEAANRGSIHPSIHSDPVCSTSPCKQPYDWENSNPHSNLIKSNQRNRTLPLIRTFYWDVQTLDIFQNVYNICTKDLPDRSFQKAFEIFT